MKLYGSDLGLGRHLVIMALLAACVVGPAGRAAVTTFTFQDGTDPDGAGTVYTGPYTGTADNRLVSSTEVDRNYGANLFMGAGMSGGVYIDRGILRFDLSALANYNALSAGTLTLHISSGGLAPIGSGTLQVFAITATDSWVEGTGLGLANPVGMSTWNNRTHPSPAWTGGAGLGSPGGGSYDSTSLDTFAWTSSSSGNFSLTIPQSVIQGWLSNPSSNNGVLLRALAEVDGNRFFVSTAEDATIANRPLLSFGAGVPEPMSAAFLAVGALVLWLARKNV